MACATLLECPDFSPGGFNAAALSGSTGVRRRASPGGAGAENPSHSERAAMARDNPRPCDRSPERHGAHQCRGGSVNFHWVSLGLAIATSMVGQTFLKLGASAPSFVEQLFDWRTILGLALYGGSALLYIVALRRIPMSVALPCTAVSYVVAALIGHYGFAEPLELPKIAGIAMICVGVVILALG
jgi:small multidrug resistance pump